MRTTRCPWPHRAVRSENVVHEAQVDRLKTGHEVSRKMSEDIVECLSGDSITWE